MMRRKSGRSGLFRAMAFGMFVSGMGVSGASSDREWEADLEFLIRLGRERFDFYADMQRQRMSSLYSDRPDEMRLANAVYYFSIRKASEAEKYLSVFKRGHRLYTQVLFLRGTKYSELRQFPQAEKSFREYLQLIPEAPSGKRARSEFVTVLQYFNQVLKEQGKGEEAAALIDRMPPDDSMGEREVLYLKQLSRIDAEEGKLSGGKPLNGKLLEESVKELKSLLFVRDGISALAAIQVARVHCLLGNRQLLEAKGNKDKIKGIRQFKSAIQVIKQFEDYFREMEEQNSKETSPMPDGLFYKAQAIRGLSEVTAAGGNLALAGAQLSRGAVQYFKMIQKRYPKSPVVRKLARQFVLCEEVNARWKLNAKLDIPKGDASDLASVFEPAVVMARDQKNYKGACERYEELFKRHLTKPGAASFVSGYMQCLAMLDRYDDGKAFLEKLEKALPDEKASIGGAALLLGAYANKRMKEFPKGKVNPLKAKQEAIYFWGRNRFVDLAPGHPQASAVAYDLAVSRFNAGVAALKAAEKASGPSRAGALKAARETLKAAIPYFERVARVFSMDVKGKAAWMKVGQLNWMADEKQAAIEAFRQYLAIADAECDPAERLEAHGRLGDLFYATGRFAEARTHYEESVSQTVPGKPLASVRNAAVFRERGMAYCPMTMERESNLLTSRIAAMEERLSKLAGDGYDLEVQIRSYEKRRGDVPKERQALSERTEDVKKMLGAIRLDYRKAAQEQAEEAAARPNAAKTKEEFFTIFLKGVEDAARTQAVTETEAIKASRASLEARRTVLSTELNAAKTRKAALQKATAQQRETIAKKRARIDEIRASFKKAESDITDAEARGAKLRDVLKTSTDDQELKETREALKALDGQLAVLRNTKAMVVSVSAKQEIVQCERDIAANEAAIAENVWLSSSADEDLADGAEAAAAADAQEASLTERSAFAAAFTAAVEADEAARLASFERLRRDAPAVIAGIQKAHEAADARLTAQEKRLSERIASCRARLASLEQERKKTEAAKKPLESEWRAQKEKAVSGYRAYVQAYPRGRYVNPCMTSLAGALADLGQFREAVQQLNSLLRLPECSDEPGNASCNAEQTVDVLYQLAKAQTKAHQWSEAAGTYERLMNSRHSEVKQRVLRMPIGNLFFIADQGLDVGAPAAARAACDVIISRFGTPGSDASQLRPMLQERVYIQSAKASLRLKQTRPAREAVAALLKRNSRTAFFYDAQFLDAEALVLDGKPDEGIGKLNMLLRRVSDVALSNRIRCENARLFVLSAGVSGRKGYRENAKRIYEEIIAFGTESLSLNASWLKTPEAQANRAWIDMAYTELAKLYASDGQSDKLPALKAQYRSQYPDGAAQKALSAIQ